MDAPPRHALFGGLVFEFKVLQITMAPRSSLFLSHDQPLSGTVGTRRLGVQILAEKPGSWTQSHGSQNRSCSPQSAPASPEPHLSLYRCTLEKGRGHLWSSSCWLHQSRGKHGEIPGFRPGMFHLRAGHKLWNYGSYFKLSQIFGVS